LGSLFAFGPLAVGRAALHILSLMGATPRFVATTLARLAAFGGSSVAARWRVGLVFGI